ncbi:response regulator transcription factor [Thioalkalivibrio paradoxus]|uniref:Transcriptional regulator n=1 Tax=Thioalkalivibrio paradoxus ARh 1 TaxID=713585 RepID=W0DIU3_9GAMM|nr:response regulator transcription factor [Thioalkalivibrio paradoxus]AHE98361.1 transcriptional regulator [Thioalkalivibrio paradoxus ARh 1]
MRLLLVEDDAALRRRVAVQLEAAGFAVDHADNGIDAEFLGSEIDYDVVVLDLGLPGRDGLSVLAGWRSRGRRLPVLVLTARDAWFEKVEGFKAGADDYLAKPFHIEELVARLRALVRRGGGQEGTVLEWGGLSLDEERRSVTVDGGPPCDLSRIEYRLLRVFLSGPGRVLSKARIAEHVYDDSAEHESNVIEAHIKRLRRKIGVDRIETVRGQGYRLRDPSA